MKDMVQKTKVNNTIELNSRITATTAVVNEGKLGGTWTQIGYQLDVVHAINEAHIEEAC